MRAFINIFWYRFKSFYRDKIYFFFTIIFPILMVLIFGLVFGGGSEEIEKTKLALLKNDKILIETVKEIPGVEIELVEDINTMKDLVLKGKVDGGIIFKSEKFKIIINFTSFQQKPYIRTIGETISSYYSKREVRAKKLINIEEEAIDPGRARVSRLGYTIPGVVSISIAMGGLFSMITLFGYYKKEKVLKRFAVTPVNPFTFILGIALGNFLATFCSAIFVFFLSKIVFRISFVMNWALFFLSSSSSILGMMALGIFLAEIFKEPQTANNVGVLFLNIMMFFSGIYFPLDFLPKYLKDFSKILPLTYIAQSLRISVGVEEGSPQFIINLSIIMLISFIILLLIFGRRLLEIER
ncbi:MAG: ABC transporter permease [Dictyoglomaceae bacterium]